MGKKRRTDSLSAENLSSSICWHGRLERFELGVFYSGVLMFYKDEPARAAAASPAQAAALWIPHTLICEADTPPPILPPFCARSLPWHLNSSRRAASHTHTPAHTHIKMVLLCRSPGSCSPPVRQSLALFPFSCPTSEVRAGRGEGRGVSWMKRMRGREDGAWWGGLT